jgi:large subunit ribosomal protein L4
MFTLPIHNSDGKEIDTITLDENIFNDKILASSIYLVINSYMANQRQGLAQTKTRGEVSGGGKKPWKQKGTGRARVGSSRNPLWRHGGVVFGPHPRDFGWDVPKKLKNQAVKFALSQKAKNQDIIIVDKLTVANSKTKDAVKILSNLKVAAKCKACLLILDKADQNLLRAFKNIGFLRCDLAANTNTYELLSAHKVIFTLDGLKAIVQRLNKN